MKKSLRIFLYLTAAILLLLGLAPIIFYYATGINYFAIAKTYTRSEIEEEAKTYSSNGVFLIKPTYFTQYGKGHFPKYRIYNQNHVRINTYACYESLPELPVIIEKDRDKTVTGDTFEIEAKKIRNTDNTAPGNLFVESKYNMIFYYKNAMNRLQKKRLNNILTHNLGSFNDSLNVVFVNVDAVDF